MGTRIGYVIRGNNDDTNLPPAMMLFSNEVSDDAEAIFKDLCSKSIGPTDFMHELAQVNIDFADGKQRTMFSLDASHEDTEKVITVHWEYEPREEGSYPVFSES